MIRAQIIDTWQSVNGVTRPCLVALLQPGDSLMDVSGEAVPVDTPHVTPLVVEVWCGQFTLDAIIASNSYGPGAVLFDEELPDASAE